MLYKKFLKVLSTVLTTCFVERVQMFTILQKTGSNNALVVFSSQDRPSVR